MDNNIHYYRQPMVTAIGIVLGFVLAFAGKWATDPATATDTSDYFVGLGMLAGIVLLIIALYRVLNNKHDQDTVDLYYRRTLKMFIGGLICAFSGVVLGILQTIWSH
ncbi:hypothetical protein [Arthrobacter sp. HLT1-20]